MRQEREFRCLKPLSNERLKKVLRLEPQPRDRVRAASFVSHGAAIRSWVTNVENDPISWKCYNQSHFFCDSAQCTCECHGKEKEKEETK